MSNVLPFPSDSADARDQRDDQAGGDRTTEPAHDPRCRDGWAGEDSEGRPRPCLQCRPHVARYRRQLDAMLGRRFT